MIRIIFVTLALLLAATSAAHAEPISAAIAIIGGILKAGGFAALLIKTAFSVALSVGVGFLQRALQKKPPRPGVKFEIEVGDDNPLGFVVGRYATAGTRKYAGTWGQVDRTPNAYFVDVVQVGDIPAPMSETNRPALWLNGEKLTILWDETPTDQGYPVEEYRDDQERDHLWVRYVDGTQTASDAYLSDTFGSHEDRPWEDDMIGLGCPYFTLTALANSDLFNGGLQWLFEPPIHHWYDLRKDDTAGGDGEHRWNDQSTWEPSENPAVIVYNLIRGVYYDDGDGFREWVYGGQDLPAWRLPAANWMAAANECDAEIDLDGGGTEPQFRCGYEVRGDMEPLAVVEELLKACNGRLACVGGTFKIQIGLPGSAVYSFTDDHIVVTKGQSYEPFPSLDATHNGIEATYPEPAEAWAMKDAPARYSSALEAEDGDRRLATGISYAASPHALQVQRLMKMAIEDARRFRVHSFYLPPDASTLEPAVDMVSWTSPRNGYADKKFLLMRAAGERTMNQLVILKEVDPADGDWNPGTDEQPTPVGPLGPIRPAPQVISGFGVEAVTIDDEDGNPRRPGIRLYWDWDGDQRDIEAVQYEVRLAFDESEMDRGRTDRPEAGAVIIAPFALLPDTDYEVRARFVSKSKKRRMAWSFWLPVTTDDIRLGATDLYPISLDQLDEQFEELTDWLEEETESRILDMQYLADRFRTTAESLTQIALQVTEQDFRNYTDRETIRREMNLVRGTIEAGYSEAINVAIGPDSAIATSLTVLEVETADLGAAVSAEQTARISGDEALANDMVLLSAGAAQQFDWKRLWSFDTDRENFTGNGTPTWSGGWVRPANHASDPYIISPQGIDALGTQYTQVRFRVRRIGTPTWEGYLWWRSPADGSWDAGRRTSIAEPTWVDNTASVTVEVGWTGTIDRIRLDFTAAADNSNHVIIDWIAIGRPAPGASYAALLAEQTARIDADSAMAADLLVLTGAITDPVTGLAASFSAISTVNGRVDTVEVTANGKNKVFRQSSQPTNGESSNGDLWFKSNEDDKPFRRSSPGTWVAVDDKRLPSLVTLTTAMAEDISELAVDIDGKASASALSSLSIEVSDLDGVVTGQATKIDDIFLALGDSTGSIRAKWSIDEASPGGGIAIRYGLQLKGGTDGSSYRSAKMFAEVPSDPDGDTSWLFEADSFIIRNGSNKKAPFTFIGGVATMQVAAIGTVTSGLLQSTNGKFKIDLDGGFMEIRT